MSQPGEHAELFAAWDAALAEGRLELWPRRRRQLVGTVAGAGLTVWMATVFALTFAWRLLPFTAVFAAMTVLNVRGLRRSRAGLVATGDGVRIGTSTVAVRVPWEMLRSAGVTRAAFQRLIVLEVSAAWTPQEFIDGPRWLRSLARRRKRHQGEVFIPRNLDVDQDAFAEWLDARAQAD